MSSALITYIDVQFPREIHPGRTTLEIQRAIYLQYYPQDLQLVEGTIHYIRISLVSLSLIIIHPDPPHAHTFPDPPALAPPTSDLPLAHFITRNLLNTSSHLQHSLPLPRAHSAHYTQARPVYDWCGVAQRVVPLRRVLGVWK